MALETRIPMPSTTKSVQEEKERSVPPLKGKTLVLFYVLLFSLNLVRVCVVIPWAAHLSDALATLIDLVDKAGIWIGLTYLFVVYGEKQRFFTAINLKGQVLRGILVGLIGSLIPLSLMAMQVVFNHHTLHLSVNTLFGTLPVICAGLIEEIPFRGFLLRQCQTRMSLSAAIFLNAILFVGIHLPMWLSEGMHPSDMLHTGFQLLILAILFCLAVVYSKSLWSSILIHTVNNILSLF